MKKELLALKMYPVTFLSFFESKVCDTSGVHCPVSVEAIAYLKELLYKQKSLQRVKTIIKLVRGFIHTRELPRQTMIYSFCSIHIKWCHRLLRVVISICNFTSFLWIYIE